MSVNSKMTAIANAVRDLLGISGTMGLDAMATNISGAKTAVDAALAALTEKGVTVPDGTKVDGLAALIAAIESGGGAGGSGGIGYSSGRITFAEDTTKYVIQHGLGEVPSLMLIFQSGSNRIYDAGSSWISLGLNAGNSLDGYGCIEAYGNGGKYSNFYAFRTDDNIESRYTFPSINNANSETINVFGTSKAFAGATYDWYAFKGVSIT